MDNQYNYVDNNYNGGNNKNFGDVACIVGFSVAILTSSNEKLIAK